MNAQLLEELADWVMFRDAHPDHEQVSVWALSLLGAIAIECEVDND